MNFLYKEIPNYYLQKVKIVINKNKCFTFLTLKLPETEKNTGKLEKFQSLDKQFTARPPLIS